jgi:hypothetical protein
MDIKQRSDEGQTKVGQTLDRTTGRHDIILQDGSMSIRQYDEIERKFNKHPTKVEQNSNKRLTKVKQNFNEHLTKIGQNFNKRLMKVKRKSMDEHRMQRPMTTTTAGDYNSWQLQRPMIATTNHTRDGDMANNTTMAEATLQLTTLKCRSKFYFLFLLHAALRV